MTDIAPFLMFEGRAEEAMDAYVALFADGEVLEANRYGAGGPGPEGSIVTARFRIAGQTFWCSDSFVKHAFSFTPSISIFVTCADEAEQDRLWAALIVGGSALMDLGDYGFSRRFGWLNDRFGVSWQINLPHA